jgi:hypothetical protein
MLSHKERTDCFVASLAMTFKHNSAFSRRDAPGAPGRTTLPSTRRRSSAQELCPAIFASIASDTPLLVGTGRLDSIKLFTVSTKSESGIFFQARLASLIADLPVGQIGLK